MSPVAVGRGAMQSPFASFFGLALLLTLGIGLAIVVALRSFVGHAAGTSLLLIVEDGGGTTPRADSIVAATWNADCGEVTVTLLPRDLVAGEGGEQLAVAYESLGAAAVADIVGSMLGTRVAAVVAVDLDGVERISEVLGPIPVRFPRAVLDVHTGLQVGPGRARLMGSEAVAYLRSRSWTEWDGERWVDVGRSDLDRLEHVEAFVERAVSRLERSDPALAFDVLREALRVGDIDVIDPVALPALLAGAASGDVAVGSVDVEPELSAIDRRSPFDPTTMGAQARLVLAGAPPWRSTQCDRVEEPA